MFDTLDISASGLQAQRTRMDTIAANIANINTTHSVDGKVGPYRRRFAVFNSGLASRGEGAQRAGVHVSRIQQDPSPFQPRHQPGHQDADARGMVLYPNIDLSTEYVNALECSRAYEANITTMEVTKAMMNASLRLLA